MAYLSQYQYYENGGAAPANKNWGSYQYVSLEDIVNNFQLMYSGNHSLVNNKALELTVYDNLTFVLPNDYINWIRISLYKDGWLRPLNENIQVNSAQSYLQGAGGTLTFNADGTVITDDSTLDTERKNGQQNSIYLNQNNAVDQVEDDNASDFYSDYSIGARYGLNTETAKVNPTFRIDKKAGVINFDSTMLNENCILEYISDGMEGGDDSQVSVNKLFEDYVYAYIEYAILNSKFNVQEYVINRARKRKTALLRNAKIRLSNIHPGRLLMNLRGQNKWIK